MPLKNADITAALKSGTAAKLSDGHSLYFITNGRGAGSWVYEFRDAGKLRSKGLGPAADVSVSEARRKREDFRADRRNGVASLPTIASPPTAARQAPTAVAGKPLREACRTYVSQHASEWKDRGAQYWAAVTNHCGPLADKLLPAITRDDVAAVLRPIWRGPTTGAGMKLRGFLEHVFAANDIEPNVATWERLQHVLPRDTVATVSHAALPSADVPMIMAELAACSGPAAEVARALRFCVLTATRTQETVDCDWSEIHMSGVNGYSGPTWLIPASRMKKGREHAIPLTAEMLALLGTSRKTGRVFTTGNTASGAINPTSMLKLLKKLRPGVTCHGFRSSFASWAEAQKVYSTKAIDLCLAHVEGNRTRRAYLRAALWDERRALMGAWAAFSIPAA
jgi:integrase